jgi:hypothetical protein
MKDIAEFTGAIAPIAAIAVLILNIVMALAVNRDAKHLVAARSGLFLLSPFVWGLIAFVFSLAGFALYWAVHHSSLRSAAPPQTR